MPDKLIGIYEGLAKKNFLPRSILYLKCHNLNVSVVGRGMPH